MREHLDADRQKHDRQRWLQIAEDVQRAGESEIERAEAEDGEHVAREDQKGSAVMAKIGGNRVHREYQICRLDHHEGQRERCQHPPAAANLLDATVAVCAQTA